jgi:exodeoxyribonuclease VII small subunit
MLKGRDLDADRKNKETFTTRMTRLKQIVERLESEDIELEEALAAFEEGMKISKACAKSLTAAERKVEMLLRQANGETTLEPFDPGLDDEDESEES